jgi:prevent-host-death family protein
MIEVGVRELKNNLAAYLRRAEAGESIAITRRGRRVAIIGPYVERSEDAH